jgi:hypothetical protein
MLKKTKQTIKKKQIINHYRDNLKINRNKKLMKSHITLEMKTLKLEFFLKMRLKRMKTFKKPKMMT